MKNGKEFNFIIAVVLVFALIFPQGVFAFTGNLSGSSHSQRLLTTKTKNTGYIDGELILKSRGNIRDESRIIRKYNLRIKRRDLRLGYILATGPRGTDVKDLVGKLQKEEIASISHRVLVR